MEILRSIKLPMQRLFPYVCYDHATHIVKALRVCDQRCLSMSG